MRQDEGHPFPADVGQLAEEIDHSALLRRLMEGKDALPDAPPLSFSYPWYKLVEDGFDTPTEVSLVDWPGDGSLGGCDSVLINQHPWRIVKANYIDESYVVRFGTSTLQYRLSKTGIGSDDSGHARKLWRIERM